MQLKSSNNLGTTEDDYLAVVTAKTAALFAASAEAGAAVAGASPALDQGACTTTATISASPSSSSTMRSTIPAARNRWANRSATISARPRSRCRSSSPISAPTTRRDGSGAASIESGPQHEDDLETAIAYVEQTGAIGETHARARAYADAAIRAVAKLPSPRDPRCADRHRRVLRRSRPLSVRDIRRRDARCRNPPLRMRRRDAHLPPSQRRHRSRTARNRWRRCRTCARGPRPGRAQRIQHVADGRDAIARAGASRSLRVAAEIIDQRSRRHRLRTRRRCGRWIVFGPAEPAEHLGRRNRDARIDQQHRRGRQRTHGPSRARRGLP